MMASRVSRPRKPHGGGPNAEGKFRLKGSIRVVLTWNLTERAFLKSDGSQDKYPLLRGSGEFAKFIRNLGDRLAASNCFELDPDNKLELESSYQAGLISQYAAEYEFNSTYRIKSEMTGFDFLSSIEKERGFRDGPTDKSFPNFSKAWDAWPIKRFRLSRYGFLQVILERESQHGLGENEDGLVTSTQFISPLNLLHASMKIDSSPKSGTSEQEIGRNWNGRPELGVTVQWEIVGRILSRLIRVIDADSRNDLLRFDSAYRWREKPGFTAGASLPLRTEFLILSITKVSSLPQSTANDLTSFQRSEIARLLEELPLVGGADAIELSPQRPETIERILQNDESTWNKEVCLLSFGTAVIAAVHPPKMILPYDLAYENYWKIVERVFEYFAELRQLARLVERQASDLFEYMMHDLATSGHLERYELYARRSAALAGLVNRLRVAAAPATIAQSDSILPKVARLRSMFEIDRSLDHADRTYSATQNLLSSAESRQNEKGLRLLLEESQKNEKGIRLLIEESQKTEKGILLLTAGLAGFTAILMGLALPPFYHYSDYFEMGWSRFGLPELVSSETAIFLWGNFSVLLTGTALITAAIFTVKRFELSRYAKSILSFLPLDPRKRSDEPTKQSP